uniref:Transposase n=1 Tax=Peronospora matthiolae TaxID=2874970 RepID=A0AAV1U2B9_9STRA
MKGSLLNHFQQFDKLCMIMQAVVKKFRKVTKNMPDVTTEMLRWDATKMLRWENDGMVRIEHHKVALKTTRMPRNKGGSQKLEVDQVLVKEIESLREDDTFKTTMVTSVRTVRLIMKTRRDQEKKEHLLRQAGRQLGCF